jgi:hypothetical protein
MAGRSSMRIVDVENLGLVSMPERPQLLSLPDREVTVTYPAARPEVYLRWLSYFREVEAAMLEHPGLADLALKEVGPFVEGETAGFISTAIWSLASQVREARTKGLQVVAPTVSGNARLLALSLLLAEQRNAWLEAEVSGRPLVEVLGIESLDREGHALRSAAIDTVRQQLLALV